MSDKMSARHELFVSRMKDLMVRWEKQCGHSSTVQAAQIQRLRRDVMDAMKVVEDRAKSTQDVVNHPPHYTSSAACCMECGRRIECIDVIEHMPANLANAMKYAWRCDYKHPSPTEDLRKAIWYLQREIERRERLKANQG